jgi:3-isopropylmalate dehydratase small subunit
MPCVTADHASLSALMQLVTADPAVQLVVDLETMRVSAGEKNFRIALPSTARESFLDGTWDATGLLLDRFEEVEAVAKRLPYVTGVWR